MLGAIVAACPSPHWSSFSLSLGACRRCPFHSSSCRQRCPRPCRCESPGRCVASSQTTQERSHEIEFALGRHGLFDQLPGKLTALTPGRPRKFNFQEIQYEFRRIKPDLYFGYEEVSVDGHSANLAELEKALLDYLYYRIDTYCVDLVREKLAEGIDDIDHDRLASYAERFPVSVQRRLGFLLDLAGASTEGLYQMVKKRPGYGKLTRASDRFNAKWRIYYEDRFTE